MKAFKDWLIACGYKPATVAAYIFWERRGFKSVGKGNASDRQCSCAKASFSQFSGEITKDNRQLPVNVPEFLTKEEVIQVVGQLSGDSKLLAMLGYGTGLRLMELLRLRVKDFDFGNGLITVFDGKGGKNRVVPMPKTLAGPLRDRLAATKLTHESDLTDGLGAVWLPDALARKYPKASKSLQWQWAFPSRAICRAENGERRRHHLFPTGFQAALRDAAKAAGIAKRVSPHILRHTHATHLLEMGRSITEVQARLGHSDVRTTMIYLHCVQMKSMPSPMDCLCEH